MGGRGAESGGAEDPARVLISGCGAACSGGRGVEVGGRELDFGGRGLGNVSGSGLGVCGDSEVLFWVIW